MSHPAVSLRLEIIRTAAEFDALAADWCELERSVAEVLPFQTYHWNRQWWAHFAIERLPREDELYITAFYDADRLVGILPLFVSRFGVGKQRVCRYLRPLGADPNLTEIRAPLMLPSHQRDVLAHWLDLVSDLKYVTTQFQVVAPLDAFDALASQSDRAHLLDRRVIQDFILDIRGDWATLRSGFKRNIKESIRRCYNSIARDQLVHELTVLERSSEILATLPSFYALHGVRAQAADTIEHPDYFADERHRAFIESLVHDADEAVQLKLFCLKLNGQTVAMRLGFVSKNSLYLYYSGYDLAYGKYSVMTTLVVEMFKWAIDRGIHTANMSIGSDVSKTRWGPREVRYGDYHFSKNSFWGRQLASVILKMKSSKRNLNPFQNTGGPSSRSDASDQVRAVAGRTTMKMLVIAAAMGECVQMLPI